MKERKEIKLSLRWHILERYYFTLIQWNQFSGIKGDTSDKDNYYCFFVEWEILRISSFTFSFFLPSLFYLFDLIYIWGKVVKNGPSTICGRQPLKNLKWCHFRSYQLLPYQFKLQPYHFTYYHITSNFLKVDHITLNFLKAVFHEFHLVHPWILCPICKDLLCFFSRLFETSRPYHCNFFKGCLPQIALGPFLNTLPHM